MTDPEPFHGSAQRMDRTPAQGSADLALVMVGTVMCIAALITAVSVGVPGWLFWTVVGLVAVFLLWAVVRLGRRTR